MCVHICVYICIYTCIPILALLIAQHLDICILVTYTGIHVFLLFSVTKHIYVYNEKEGMQLFAQVQQIRRQKTVGHINSQTNKTDRQLDSQAELVHPSEW